MIEPKGSQGPELLGKQFHPFGEASIPTPFILPESKAVPDELKQRIGFLRRIIDEVKADPDVQQLGDIAVRAVAMPTWVALDFFTLTDIAAFAPDVVKGMKMMRRTPWLRTMRQPFRGFLDPFPDVEGCLGAIVTFGPEIAEVVDIISQVSVPTALAETAWQGTADALRVRRAMRHTAKTVAKETINEAVEFVRGTPQYNKVLAEIDSRLSPRAKEFLKTHQPKLRKVFNIWTRTLP
ncbi:hypothetical protein HYW54_02010 [Candidatus Gottesmanbacteria bacterium]|nr:hypothetical protein [Candidatus Gottesmanbacteria bacterium]